MNYHSPPDLRPDEDLTVDALKLFQRFRQDADLARVDAMLDAEFTRHVRQCELAIMQAAAADIFWAKLPRHPLLDFNAWAARHLEERGFVVKFTQIARGEEVPHEDDKKPVNVMVVESNWTAEWFMAPSLNGDTTTAEWRRRIALEDEEIARTPPQRQSSGSGATFESGGAVWAAVLDEEYVVEIQRRYHRNFLCLFGLDGKFLHAERSTVSYGAMFGPDAGDVAQWAQRAQEIVDGWKGGAPT